MPETSSPPVEPSAARHEARDVNARGVWLSGGVLVAVVVLSLVAVWGLFDYLAARERHHKQSVWPLAREGHLPPQPRLEGIEIMQGAGSVSDRSAQQQLETYGWVDRQAGIVRLPIDRAMRIIVERMKAREQPAVERPVRPSAANSGRGFVEEKR